MGLVDADYKFIYIDVGCNGRISDGGVFRNGHLSKALEQNTLKVPPAEILPQSEKRLPFVVVGDDAFPLKNYLMKPYPHQGLPREQRIFNYRLSRARRIVENAFGILANRFRVFIQLFTCLLIKLKVLSWQHVCYTTILEQLQLIATLHLDL